MAPRWIGDLPTPAVLIDADLLDANLAAMAAVLPGDRLRPHVKAHKCTALAAVQHSYGHHGFTCATPREVLGMAAAGLGEDLLLANETIDPRRLGAMAALTTPVTVAVDSSATVAAAATAGIQRCVIDVNVGLPRCGVDPAGAGALADLARLAGLEVRGVMGYEGHLMMVTDPVEKAERVAAAMDLLYAAAADVGGEIISAGGTGTYGLHLNSQVTEVQAGSYALMDTHYGSLRSPFVQALWILGTVISVAPDGRYVVADVGLKALGMDHGNPTVEAGKVWFCSDEHLTFAPHSKMQVGDQVRVTPAHIDPTLALHKTAWIIKGDEVIDQWAIDLRGWDV
jgi:D-serine deaminase-like pyridoxal phosphate-dependent protein